MTVGELLDELTRLVDEHPHAADATVQAIVDDGLGGHAAGHLQRVEWRGGTYVDLLDTPHPTSIGPKALRALLAEVTPSKARQIEDVDTGGTT